MNLYRLVGVHPYRSNSEGEVTLWQFTQIASAHSLRDAMESADHDFRIKSASEIYGEALTDAIVSNPESAPKGSISLAEYRLAQQTHRPIAEAEDSEEGIFTKVVNPETLEQWARRSPLALFPDSPSHYLAIGKLLNSAGVCDAGFQSTFSEIEGRQPDTTQTILAVSGLNEVVARQMNVSDLCRLLWKQAEAQGL